MTRYEMATEELRSTPRTWLVTGVAGFIGSNLLEQLLSLGQYVVGLDNLSTGYRRNVDDVLDRVGGAGGRFHFVEGDVRDLGTCRAVCAGVDYVLHQAALGSVPRSIDDPLTSHASNVDGFVTLLVAARDARVRRVVFASSSAVYGDHAELPKREERIGRPLSPYAVTKLVGELYADVFQRIYGVQAIGLRYFNVFGRRQDPRSAYAAVIPRWVTALLAGEPCVVFGDGETTRDYCYIDNVVQANILAATVRDEGATHQVYNVACGERTTLSELFRMVRAGLAAHRPALTNVSPLHEGFRPGDIRHSIADTTRIEQRLGYVPTHSVAQGIDEALVWYIESNGRTVRPGPALGTPYGIALPVAAAAAGR
jgi:UDP-N-acetylglucosamine 4-epimerase